MPHSALSALASALATHRPLRVEPQPHLAQASVALLVRPAPALFDILLIQRAERAGDPWSGHMAFPGGRREPEDATALATAIRETDEEVRINLAHTGTLIGELDDVAPRGGTRSVVVSPFVFTVPEATAAHTTPEVFATHWIPVGRLLSREARTEYLHYLDTGWHARFPAFAHEGQVIWGLTHRILQQFLSLAIPVRGRG
jgi:8-oxo-dGTP pyrophosphatase MutT (NUDIX family)